MSYVDAYHWATVLLCVLVYAGVGGTHATILQEEEPERFAPGFRSATGALYWKVARAVPLFVLAFHAWPPLGLLACSGFAGLGAGSAAFRLSLNHGMGWPLLHVGTTKWYDRLLRRHTSHPGRLAYWLDASAFAFGTGLTYTLYA